MFSPVSEFLEVMLEKRRRFLAWVEGQFTTPAPLPPVMIRPRSTPADPRYKGACVFVFAGNRRTKGAYHYLGIPMKFLTQGVNRFFAFRDDLMVVVELVPDEEIALPRFRQRGYRLGLGRGPLAISLPESRKDDIIELSARGFADLCKHLDLPGWHEDLYQQVLATIREIMDQTGESAPPRPEPPPPSPVVAFQGDEEAEPEECGTGQGVPVIFFTLLIKMASLEKKYPGGVQHYIEDRGPYDWIDDGRLLRAVSMDGDFDSFITPLMEHGLTCSEDPVDFYILDGGPGTSWWGITILTRDDGCLEYGVDEKGHGMARLRDEEVTQ